MDLEELSDIFSGLHDGGITGYEGDYNKLRLKIQCDYIAEMIKPGYQFFYLDLYNVTKFELEAWDGNDSLFQGPEKALQAELEIGHGDVKDDCIVVYCLKEPDEELDYAGGNLIIKCSDIKIYDHELNEVTIDEFYDIRKKYWDRFTQK